MGKLFLAAFLICTTTAGHAGEPFGLCRSAEELEDIAKKCGEAAKRAEEIGSSLQIARWVNEKLYYALTMLGRDNEARAAGRRLSAIERQLAQK